MLKLDYKNLLEIDPKYFNRCRDSAMAMMKSEFNNIMGDISDVELKKRVESAIKCAIDFGFISHGSLRYFVFLCFNLSPFFPNNKKVKKYFEENNNGDVGLQNLISEIDPINWVLLTNKKKQKHWNLAIKNREKRKSK